MSSLKAVRHGSWVLRSAERVSNGCRFQPAKNADNTRREFSEIFGQECAVEKALRILVVGRRTVIPDMIKVNGEFGRIERTTVA